MAKQVRPVIQKKFGGLYTAEHPLERPPQSASLVDNFDVLPGNWLRLMSGRIGRVQATSATGIPMIMPVSLTQNYGSAKHLTQITYSPGNDHKIVRLDIAGAGTFTLDEATPIEDLLLGLDTFTIGNGTPWAQLPNSIIYNNGKGRRTGGDNEESEPALSQWKPDGTLRYFGLYPVFYGSPAPALSFTAGAGNNQVFSSVQIWVGLYSSGSDHYSNAVFVGTQGPTGGLGTLTVNNLSKVGYATHGSSETDELHFVFYASLDDFETPFLIMNATLDGPFKVPVTDPTVSTGISLSIASATDNGWDLDRTKERPVNNWPPRSFSSICYSNGRNYAILSPGKTNTTYPEYKFTEKELSGVVWSEAEGSSRTKDFLGDPLQSWPPKNFSPVQAGQYPRVVFPAPGGTRTLVLSATHTWLLEEAGDGRGVHTWKPLSDEHGISSYLESAYSNKCICRTRHGTVWVTQRNLLAILETGSEEVKILNADCPDAIPPGSGTQAVNCVTYIYDPVNHIDRVDVHFTAAVADSPRNPFSDVLVNRILRYDFNNGISTATVEGYTTMAAPMIGGSGLYFQVQAKQYPGTRSGLYTVEGQPDQSWRIPTKIETFVGAAAQDKSVAEQLPGIWIGQWLDFGDSSKHNEVHHVDVLGDIADSSFLSGVSPLSVRYFNGFTTAVAYNAGTLLEGEKTPQESGDYVYRFPIADRHKRYWKFAFILESHAADFGSYFLIPTKEADQAGAGNFYGAIMIVMPTLSRRENRD